MNNHVDLELRFIKCYIKLGNL